MAIFERVKGFSMTSIERLYAMYKGSKKLLALFIVMCLGEIIGMAIIFALPIPGEIGAPPHISFFPY